MQRDWIAPIDLILAAITSKKRSPRESGKCGGSGAGEAQGRAPARLGRAGARAARGGAAKGDGASARPPSPPSPSPPAGRRPGPGSPRGGGVQQHHPGSAGAGQPLPPPKFNWRTCWRRAGAGLGASPPRGPRRRAPPPLPRGRTDGGTARPSCAEGCGAGGVRVALPRSARGRPAPGVPSAAPCGSPSRSFPPPPLWAGVFFWGGGGLHCWYLGLGGKRLLAPDGSQSIRTRLPPALKECFKILRRWACLYFPIYFPRALSEMPGPRRKDAAVPVPIFWGLLHVRTVKVLWTIYRQNIWFVKAKLLDEDKQTLLLCKFTYPNNLHSSKDFSPKKNFYSFVFGRFGNS